MKNILIVSIIGLLICSCQFIEEIIYPQPVLGSHPQLSIAERLINTTWGLSGMKKADYPRDIYHFDHTSPCRQKRYAADSVFLVPQSTNSTSYSCELGTEEATWYMPTPNHLVEYRPYSNEIYTRYTVHSLNYNSLVLVVDRSIQSSGDGIGADTLYYTRIK